MYTALMALHILVCLAIIFIILIQKSSRGAEMGAAFGGSSQTIFGASGALTFLNKMTTVIACLFVITSLMLTRFTAPSPESSIMTEQPAVEQPVAKPAEQPAPPVGSAEQAPASEPIASEKQSPAAEPITGAKEQAPAAQPQASEQPPAPAAEKAAEPPASAPAAPAQGQPVEKPDQK